MDADRQWAANRTNGRESEEKSITQRKHRQQRAAAPGPVCLAKPSRCDSHWLLHASCLALAEDANNLVPDLNCPNGRAQESSGARRASVLASTRHSPGKSHGDPSQCFGL